MLVIGLSIALLITGFAIEDTALQLVGLAFLFTAGSLFLAGTVEYQTGEQINTSYSYNINSSDINETLTNTNYQYTNFNDGTSKFIGIFLMIVSILASAVIYTRLKDEDE